MNGAVIIVIKVNLYGRGRMQTFNHKHAGDAFTKTDEKNLMFSLLLKKKEKKQMLSVLQTKTEGKRMIN